MQQWTVDNIAPTTTSPAADIAGLKSSLESLRSNFSGTSEIIEIVAAQFFADLSNNLMKIRSGDAATLLTLFSLLDGSWQGSVKNTPAGGIGSSTVQAALNELDAKKAAVGKQQLGYWPAAAIRPRTTGGCAALATDESPTYQVLTSYLAFDPNVQQFAQFSFRAPVFLDESQGITAKVEWMEAAGALTHGVEWYISIQAQGDMDAIDSTFGAGNSAIIDTGAVGVRLLSPECTAIIPSGIWQGGDEIIVRIMRNAPSANDTLDVNAKLIGVALFATVTSGVEP